MALSRCPIGCWLLSHSTYLICFHEQALRRQLDLAPSLGEEALSWFGRAMFFLKGWKGAEGVVLSLPPSISHLLSPPSFWPLSVMCIFPSVPTSHTDSLPQQGSNFQNKTFSTKENITTGKETFQYQASREPRKWAKCLSENDAVLTSQPLLGSEREQCLALGFSQVGRVQERLKLVLKLVQTHKSQM